MVFLFRSFFSSDPFMTCGEPTLFFATRVTAANDVPPSASEERDERNDYGRRRPATENAMQVILLLEWAAQNDPADRTKAILACGSDEVNPTIG
jgi:hypothetical protein